MPEKSITENFPKDFNGQIIQATDAGYEEARRVWNGLYDKFPAAIARCTNSSDVIAAVNYAREHKLLLAVRGGGHDYAGNSVCDGGLVIDLSPMNRVEVDSATKTARVQGGATWGEFDARAQEFGLVTTGGTASSIGVAGLTLGGGSGYLVRRFGLALDNLLSVEIVTADGRHLKANKEENKDLFWAIRGGSGNFGVVTVFEYQLHKVGPEVLSAQFFYPYEDSRKLLELYRVFMKEAPVELQCYAFFLKTPPVAPFPEEWQGKTAFVLMACYSGDIQRGKTMIRSLQNFGKPFFEAIQPIAYTALQKAFDAGMPKGLRWYSKAHYLDEISDAVIDTLEKYTNPLPGPFTMVYFEPMGGVVKEVDPTATAFPHRKAAYNLHVLPGWSDAAHDKELTAWAKALHNALEKDATGGVYVNLLSHDEKERVKAAYGENYERLATLKKKWDPMNVFGMNQNIKPKG